jgi:hypothetical protein
MNFLLQRHVSSCTVVLFKLSSYQVFKVKGLFPEQLQSLKPVEFVGQKHTSRPSEVGTVQIEVYIYRMCTRLGPLAIEDGCPLQAEVVELPNLIFEGIWEKSVIPSVSYWIEKTCQLIYTLGSSLTRIYEAILFD